MMVLYGTSPEAPGCSHPTGAGRQRAEPAPRRRGAAILTRSRTGAAVKVFSVTTKLAEQAVTLKQGTPKPDELPHKPSGRDDLSALAAGGNGPG